MRNRELRIIRRRPDALGVCTQCNLQFTSDKPTDSAAEAEIRAQFHRHRCQPGISDDTKLGARYHEAQFYSDDACFLDSFTQFIGTALKAENSAIVVATESHRDSLLLRLQAHGLDIGAAIMEGRYISLDAGETLSTLMVNNMPDPVRFVKVLGNLIVTAAKAAKGEQARVAACGECAPLLWSKGNAEAALQLEKLCDQLAKTYDVDILCGYQLGSFHDKHSSHIFQQICAEHSAVHSW